MRLAAIVLVCLLLVSGLGMTGCRGCSEAELARLESKMGSVDRDTKAKPQEWTAARVGATFSMGDGVRTGKSSTALLVLDDGSKLEIRPNTIVRFSDTPPKARERAFDVETGEALLDTSGAGLVLKTSLGLARIDGNSRVLLKRTTRGIRFEVRVGRAILETKNGETNEVREGQGIIVGIGEAALERISLKSEDPQGAAVPGAAAAKTAGEPEPIQGDIVGQVVGSGVRLKALTAKSFMPLTPGSVKVPSGSTIEVRKGSSLSLRHGGATALLDGAGTYQIPGGDALVRVQRGSVVLSGGRTRVDVPGGAIITAPGSGATVNTLGKKETRVQVTKSHVWVEGASGSQEVAVGQEALLDGQGQLRLQGKGLDYSDITINTGESAVVHDPKPPTAVRVLFGSACPNGGVLRVKSKAGAQFATGSRWAALPFAAGRHEYALHCLQGDAIVEEVASAGVLTILHDAGTRPVPSKPPATAVEVDGRNYTVMYQNQLPSVTLRWARAPEASSFVLRHRSGRGEHSYKLSSPFYSFRSGALAEGSHTFYFEGAGRVSRQTMVHIKFDNAAPTASLQTPVGPGIGQGEQITISGVAQPGWSVEVNGKSVGLDGQQRFSQKAEMPTDDHALAVRLTHPQRGTHIYVRRAALAHD